MTEPSPVRASALSLETTNRVYKTSITGMIGGLTIVLLLMAGAGAFKPTLMTTRERVRDLAILKTVGMSSQQIARVAMAAIFVLAFAAACIAMPLGVWLEEVIFNNAVAFLGGTFAYTVSFTPIPIGLSLLVDFLVAVAGAAVPARWAAAKPVAQVLRSE